MGEKTKKILSVVVNVVLWIFLVFAFIMMVFSLSAVASGKGMPSLFGNSFISVQSDSMSPTFKQGDLIICHVPEDKDKALLSKGDVITFKEDLNGDGIEEFKTHRIINIYVNNKSILDENGNVLPEYVDAHKTSIIYYETKGDNAVTNPIADGRKVIYTDVLCVWHDDDIRLGGVGAFLDFVGGSVGFFIIIVLPLGIFFLYEVYNLIRTIMLVKGQQKAVAGVAPLDEEEIKRRAIEEYLREEEIKRKALEEYKAHLAAQEASAQPASEEAQPEVSEQAQDNGDVSENN